ARCPANPERLGRGTLLSMKPVGLDDDGRARGKWTRREALGLAAASLAIAGCKPAAREGGQGAAAGRLVNLTGVLEASGAQPRLASLKNRQSGFEWLAGAQPLSPLFETGAQRSWKPLPASSKDGALAIAADGGDGLQAELDVTAFE